MANEYIVTGDDGTLTGKRARTNDRVVSLTTVHEHFFIAQDPTNDVQARVVSAAPSANAAGYVVWSAINTFAVANAISGVVSVSGPISGNVAISGAVSGVFSVSGNVSVTNALSGTVSVSGAVAVSNAVSGVFSLSGIASISGTVSISGAVNQGTPATTANRWPVQITDGTLLAALRAPTVDNITGASMTGVNVVNAPYYLDGSTWDAARGDSTGGGWMQGPAASGAARAGNPLMGGMEGITANPASVSNSQVVCVKGDKIGRQVFVVNHVRELVTQNRLSVAVATETQILAAGATGVFHDLTYLKVSNESQVMTRVDLRDSTAGTVRWTGVLVPGGTTNEILMVPFKQTSSATDWTVQLSVTATVHVTVQAVKNI